MAVSGYSGLRRFFLALAVALSAALPASAQPAYPTVFPKPILILDQNRMFNESKLGLAISISLAQKRTALLHESRGIDAAFEAEELRLTDLRAEISPEEFRVLSEDFDKRVQAARAGQLGKDIAMQQELDAQQQRFFALSAPYLSEIMLKYFAGAIIDQRSLLLFNRDMDITTEAIAKLDRAFEENPSMADVTE